MRSVCGSLVKATIGLDRAKNLIGRNMMEAKIALQIAWQSPPISDRRFEQHIRPDDIGLNECGRAIDGPVNVALGREVHHDIRPVIGKDFPHSRGIGDVGADEGIARIACN
jgi:hypothetical protein